MSRHAVPYDTHADLAHETVTIVVAFSGRWAAWSRVHAWITEQKWPSLQTRLLILNSTHQHLTAAELRLDAWRGQSLQIERIDAGRPHLADVDRRQQHGIRQQVEAAVACLYNRAVHLAYGEWMLFVEDDVVPLRPDAIAQLFCRVGTDVAAVSGLYRHRYTGSAVAFGLPDYAASMESFEGPDTQLVGGTGFGCLLARRSVLLQHPLSGDNASLPHYDVDVAQRIRDAGWRWILDRSVRCDHLVADSTETASDSF